MGKESINFGGNKIINGGPGNLTPRPMMTPRAVPKINKALKFGADKYWNPDEFVDEVRQEYDHKIKTAQPMGHPDWCNVCKKKMNGTQICSWTNYVQCSIETLEWRKKDITNSVKGKWATEEEVKKTHYVCDLAIQALKAYQAKHNIQAYT